MNAPDRTVLHQMMNDAWNAGAGLLIVCLVLETVERGFVSRFFNLLWLLTFVLCATVAVMATHPGTEEAQDRRRAKGTKALIQLGSLALAVAAWLLLPPALSLVWRAAASGGILCAVLLAWPALRKNE